MIPFLGEVPPPEIPPQAAYALMEFLKLVVMVVGLGLASAWGQTFGALFKWLGSVIDVSIGPYHPFRGLAHAVDAAASRVQNFFGHIAVVHEPGGVTFLTWTSTTQKAAAGELGSIAADSYAAQRRTQAVYLPWFVTHRLAPVTAHVRTATHTATKATTIAKTATKTAAAAKTATTHTKAIAHTQAVAVTQPLFGRIEHDIAAQKRTLERIAGIVSLAGFTAFFWRWASRNGLRWLRCPALGRVGSKIGCGGFSFLETLLADAFEAMLVLDLCRFAVAAQRLARLVAPELGALLLVQDAVCLGGGASLPSASDTPRVSTRITLPSAHD